MEIHLTWRRLLATLVVGFVVWQVTFLAIQVSRRWRADDAVQAQVLRLDAVDPGWRFEDLEKADSAPEPNGAQVVVRIGEALPPNWPMWETKEVPVDARPAEYGELAKLVWSRDPRKPLGPDANRLLHKELKRADASLNLLPELSAAKSGKVAIRYPLVWPDANVKDIGRFLEAAKLLECQALAFSQNNQADAACECAVRVMHIAQLMGKSHALIGVLARASLSAKASDMAERAMAVGEVSPKRLAELQAALEREVNELADQFVFAGRSERALTHRMLDAYWSGRLKLSGSTFEEVEPTSWWSDPFEYLGRSFIRDSQARFLDGATELLDSWKAPWHEREDRLWPKIAQGSFSRWHVDALIAMKRSGDALPRVQARLRVCLAAAAAERFRQDTKRWPTRLDELLPRYLKVIPQDPYTGEKLRLAVRELGISIYSVGSDKLDQGGEPHRLDGAELDMAFELWNPEHRGIQKREQ